MTAPTFFISYIRNSTKIVTVLVAFLVTAQFVLAEEKDTYNVSASWFKPTLTVNNDPKICKPLLDAYLNYFKSSQTTNPLHADIYGTRPQNDSTAIITKNLRELEWQDIQIDGVALRIAEVNLNGKYYAIVRRNYSLGWREGYFNDILINKPFAEYHLNKENHEEYFETYDFKVLAPGSKKNIFDVVYKYDPRSKNYESNIYGDTAASGTIANTKVI
ncbi:MAG: hypothetical protein FP814_05465 [Desulfobacterium sp.]|nr:hypothetical protein [Desulfobacterium sp.]MBU3948599.1 hypothetical protein [Pseudomonadota bacterium]MBU4009544.1 hypothetical protein [Pseudomonadota bacterium]MBU4036907.1 hypothetical protein [Pseudomonadota bacterium]